MYNRAKLVLFWLLLVFSDTRTCTVADAKDLVTEAPRNGHHGSDVNQISVEMNEYLKSFSTEATVPIDRDFMEFIRWQAEFLEMRELGTPVPEEGRTFYLFEYCGNDNVCFKMSRPIEASGKFKSWIYHERMGLDLCTKVLTLLLISSLLTGVIGFLNQLIHGYIIFKICSR